MDQVLKWQWNSDPYAKQRWLNAFQLLQKVRLSERMIRGREAYTLKNCHTYPYEGSYARFEHRREDYTDCVDILADAFTEIYRLSGRLHFCQYSPRDYFCNVDNTQNRQQIFLNKQAKECTSFRPTNCVLIHELLFGRGNRIHVLDPFAGWGDRAIGFAAAGCSYTGVDINKNLSPGYANLIRFLEDNQLVAKFDIRLRIADSTQVNFGSEIYDLVFTCPPYANFEVYENVPEFANTKEWFVQVLKPAMLNAAKALKKGGYMVFMLGNKDPQDTYVEDLLSLLQHSGLKFAGNIGSYVRNRDNRVMGMYVFQKL